MTTPQQHWSNIWNELQKSKFEVTESLIKYNFGDRLVAKALLSWFDEHDKKILDVGSGIGRWSFRISNVTADSKVIGVDISQSAADISCKAKRALNYNSLDFLVADCLKLPFADGEFDVVFSFGLIEDYPDYDSLFAEKVRVTRPGGKIITAVPNYYHFYTLSKKTHREIEYEKSFRPSELKALYKKYGLKNLEIKAADPVHKSPLFMLLSPKICPFSDGAREMLKKAFYLFDFVTGFTFSKIFGFELLIKGEKL